MESIGRFEIRRTLGRGAQSVVYLGFDPHLQREVALKTLRVSSQEEARQLLAEARAMSGLRHANIVPVYEAGESAGQPHLVFEYVPGGTLAERIQRGPTPPEEAVGLMLPILDALAHAHDRGLVHRDVKPANILLAVDGEPRLMDFGVAVQLAAREGDDDTRGLAGTPAYMAPEYIQDRHIRPSNDIFAAGLVLFELLTGARAVTERDVFRVMYRLAHEDLRLPAELNLPERLVNVVHKSLARDPEDRWRNMHEFRRALEASMAAPGSSDDPEPVNGQRSTLEFLLRRMRLKSDFPALSGSISAVNRIAGGAETENNAMLSSAVLKDVALTNKILRVVNSALFRHHGGPVSTVSRAVMILGFESVRNLAVALLLFENMQSRTQAESLREEFVRAMLSALMAKQLGTAAGVRNVEEAFICALFHNLGRMLALFYFPEEAQEIRRVQKLDKVTEEQAALRVLGISYQRLGMEVARLWGFPEQIVQSQRQLDTGPVYHVGTPAERACVLASLADSLSATVAEGTPKERAHHITRLTEYYGKGLRLSERQVGEALDQSLELLRDYATTFSINLGKTALGGQIARWSGRAPLDPDDSADPTVRSPTTTIPNGLPEQGIDGTLRGASQPGLPENAVNILAAGIQDISNSLVGDYKLNDLLRMILETMYRGVGFRRVLLATKDARGAGMQGRFGFGPDVHELTQKFRFRITEEKDVVQLVLSRGVDLLLTDVADPKIADRVPAWLKSITTAQTFALFPLVVKDRPVALIYAENERAGDIVIPERELGMLRTLRNQAVLAIRQTG